VTATRAAKPPSTGDKIFIQGDGALGVDMATTHQLCVSSESSRTASFSPSVNIINVDSDRYHKTHGWLASGVS
jgi:hypothetical protein